MIKSKHRMKVLVAVFVLILFAVMYFRPVRTVAVPFKVPVEVPVPVYTYVDTEPEFRKPPYKSYKPSHYQQIGLLTGQNGQTLPLYGKHSRQYNDRWNYYSTTGGDQIFSIPVTHKDRDCTEDIGCPEFYGGEEVEVFGQGQNPYTAKIYRTHS
jgi:hypothetical protein